MRKTDSPYDLNASAVRMIRKNVKKEVNIRKNASQSRPASPHDLSIGGGLTALAERLRIRITD